MSDDDFWDLIFLSAVHRGKSPVAARILADNAVTVRRRKNAGLPPEHEEDDEDG